MKLEIYPPAGKPSSPPTWDDVERLALHYVVVRQAVELMRRGELTREGALIHVAFALAGAFQQLFQGEVERRMLEVAPMMILKMPSSPGGIAPWEEKAQAVIANLQADLCEARSERQREHDRRVLCQSDAETLGAALATMTRQRDDAVRLLAFMTTSRDDARTHNDRLRERLAEASRPLEGK